MPRILDVDLGSGVVGWFTGRASGPQPMVGQAGNLSSRRPHQPARLAADRRAALARHGVRAGDVHLMRQVHGAHVERVTADVPTGKVLIDTDGAVTQLAGRALAVLTADCVPVLLAGPTVTAVAHAGRVGLCAGVLEATVEACAEAGEDPLTLRSVIGPAIGPCCYEVPEAMHDEVVAAHPVAAGHTTWGSRSLNLPAAAAAVLSALGVSVQVVPICTACVNVAWFSHRADRRAGRQAGVVVRTAAEAGS